jgi:peptidoglycan/xylan/chitin deacetylase (PgdA/CDA1 family)
LSLSGGSSVRHILNFHGIGPTHRELDPGEAAVWLEQAAFEAIVNAIRPEDRVWLTFDDGNSSDVEIAIPLLLRRNLKAGFFISTGKIGLQGYLDESQIREIAQAGMLVGSHGVSHTSWRGFDATVLRVELEESRARLEGILSKPVEHAACPLGAYDRRVLHGLRQAGYTCAYTSDGGPTCGDHWLQARSSLHSHDGPESTRRLLDARFNGVDNLTRRFKTAVKRRR